MAGEFFSGSSWQMASGGIMGRVVSRLRRGLILLSACAMTAALLAACGSDEAAYQERPVESIYNKAMDRLLGGDAELAAIDFDEVERQHPYSVWAMSCARSCPAST